MPSPTTLPPLTPREYFNFLQAKLGKTYITKKFNVGERAVERWTADEKYVGEESVRKNPIEKIEETLRDLMERGYATEAQAMVARWARLVGCEVVDCEAVTPDRQDLPSECLDDYPPLTAMHQAINERKPIELVRFLAHEAKREIDETVALYGMKEVKIA